jgi:hypothetical protein
MKKALDSDPQLLASLLKHNKTILNSGLLTKFSIWKPNTTDTFQKYRAKITVFLAIRCWKEEYREEKKGDSDLKRLLNKDAPDDRPPGNDVPGLLPLGVEPVVVHPQPVQDDVEPRVEPVHRNRHEGAQQLVGDRKRHRHFGEPCDRHLAHEHRDVTMLASS